MPWNVYSPKNKPKKPKTYTGWTQVRPAKSDPRAGWRQVFPIRGGKPSGVPGVPGTSTSSTSTSSDVSSGYDPYPAYNDPYAGLLSQLAKMKAQQEGQLRGDLAGREAAIVKLYGDQQPLVDANYGQAIKSSAAVNDAVANRLSAEGATTNADLLSKLSMIGAPEGAVSKDAGDVSKYYAGLGAANYAGDAGDVQRLISSQAEQNTYNQKQPGIIAQGLESQYQQDLRDMLKQYNEQVMGMTQAQASGQADYQMAKFGYEQDAKKNAAAVIQDKLDRYWENYWKRRDEAERRWEVSVASKDKKGQIQAKKDMQALDLQSKTDVANIRAGATVEARTIGADATVTAATIAANAKGTSKSTSNINQQRASKAALESIIDPKSGKIKSGVNPAGYNAELTMQGIINDTLRSLGVDPFGKQGAAARRSAMRQANNRYFAANPTTKYHYDPNWAKKLKKKRNKRGK